MDSGARFGSQANSVSSRRSLAYLNENIYQVT